MKSTIILMSALLLLSLSLVSFVFAQSTQASYTVSLASMTLQVTYPSEVMPGDTVTLNVQGNPKGYSGYLQSLTATIYYADAAGLHQLSTQTLVSNSPYNYGGYNYGYSNYGGSSMSNYGGSSMSYATASFSKSLTVSVPNDAPRTSLIAVFSETVQTTYYDYSSYYYFPSAYHMGMHHIQTYYYFAYYPSYSYSTSTDQALAPLSYVKATTPEFVTLQSEYQMLQQQVNQTQSQNQQLQTTVSQQSATINQLNQQVATSNSVAQTYQTLTLGLAILTVALAALGVFSIYQWRSKGKKAEFEKAK